MSSACETIACADVQCHLSESDEAASLLAGRHRSAHTQKCMAGMLGVFEFSLLPFFIARPLPPSLQASLFPLSVTPSDSAAAMGVRAGAR
eukprot:303594-Rhodomonas_salina.1